MSWLAPDASAAVRTESPASQLRFGPARPGALAPEDVAELARAAQHGLGMRTEIAHAFAREAGGDPEHYRRYLTQRIRYGLGPHELTGLEAFLARAAAAGLLPPTRLRFADDVVRSRRIRRQVSLDAALQKGADGARLDPDEAELLDEKAPLLELGLAADLRRRALHPEGVVTYIVSRNVNLTPTSAPPPATSVERAKPGADAAARQTDLEPPEPKCEIP